jgi:hypothetical protein
MIIFRFFGAADAILRPRGAVHVWPPRVHARIVDDTRDRRLTNSTDIETEQGAMVVLNYDV